MTSMNVQTLAIPLFGALDTKTSHKSLPMTSVSINENVRYNNSGRAAKRFGQQEVGSDTTTPEGLEDTLTNAKAMGVYNKEMLLIDDHAFYSYLEGANQWNNLGQVVNFNLSTQVNAGAGLDDLRYSAQTYRGPGPNGATTEFQFWLEASGKGFYTIRDDTTGAPYVVSRQLSNPADYDGMIQAAVAGSGSVVYVLTVGTLVSTIPPTLYTFDLTHPQTGPVSITAGISTPPTYFTLSAVGDVLIYQYPNGGSNVIGVVFVSGVLTTFYTTSVTGTVVNTTMIPFPGDEAVWAVGITSIDGSNNAIYTAATFTFPGGYSATKPSGSLLGIKAFKPYMALTCLSSTQFFAWAADLADATIGHNCFMVKSTVLDRTALPAFLTLSTARPGLVPFTHGFLGNNGKSYIAAVTTDTLSSGDNLAQFIVIVQDDTSVISEHLDAEVFIPLNLLNQSNLPVVQYDEVGKFWSFPVTQIGQVTFPTASMPRVGSSVSSSAKLTIGDYSSCRFLAYNNDCIINCGTVFSYDSASLVESGFWSYPQALQAAPATGMGLEVGLYSYIVVYEWRDAANNVMFSYPSAPAIVTTSIGSQQVELSFYNELITRKSNVNIQVYRTLVNNPAPYYLVLSIPYTTAINFRLLDYLVDDIIDAVPDATAALQPQLYSNPSGTGQVPNDPPPSFIAMTATKTRVFGVSAEDTTKIWYTKPYIIGLAAGWSSLQTITVEAAGGAPTAIGNLDNLLAVFKSSRIYIVAGDGPDVTGSPANGFTDPQQIASVSGCISPGSVVLTDLGLFYQSQRGIEMLTRSQSIDYTIGLPVNAYRGIPISSVISVPSANQIRFLSNDNNALIYDYIAGQWSTYSNYDGVGGGIWLGNFVRATTSGHIYQEVANTFMDDAAPVSMVIETAWLKPGTIGQGYARVRRFAVFGEYVSPHLLQIDIGINYQDYAYTILWNPVTSQIVSVSTYGSSTPYGSDVYYGGDSPVPVYQMRSRMPVQKCESVRYKITDLPNLLTGTGESCTLVELAMEINAKTGVMRLPGNQTE